MADATALERAHLTIRGVRAELVLEGGQITLSKDGPPSTSLSFPVDRVRGTVLEPGSRGGRGWIHLAVVGGTLAPPGELAAMSDPYTIPLTSRSAVTARRLARFVEKHLQERGLPPEPTFAASALERGRFSSGVALAQAPGAVRTVVDLRPDLRVDDGPPAPPAGNGSSLATESSASIEWAPDPSAAPEPSAPEGSGSDTPPWRRDLEDDAPRAVRTAAAEAVLEERAAIETDTLGASLEADDDAVIEPTEAPGGWVKPSGASQREATDADLSPESAPSPAASASPTPTAPPPLGPPTPPAVAGRELAAELRELGELHASGVLTDAEFEQAKARVLR